MAEPIITYPLEKLSDEHDLSTGNHTAIQSDSIFVGSSSVSPAADGNNIFYYKFNTAAIATDSGDYVGGPYTLSTANQGAITQQASSVAVYYDQELAGATAAANRLEKTSGNWVAADVATGFTFYLNFHVPATMNNSEVQPLYQRCSPGVGFSSLGILFAFFLFKAGGNIMLQGVISNTAGTNFINLGTSPLTPNTNHRLVVTLAADGITYSATLDEVSIGTGVASGDVRVGWIATDTIEILGGVGANYLGAGLTQVAYTDIAVDQLLLRAGVDVSPLVFDATFTGNTTITYASIDGGNTNISSTALQVNSTSNFTNGLVISSGTLTIATLVFPNVDGNTGDAITTNGAGTLSFSTILNTVSNVGVGSGTIFRDITTSNTINLKTLLQGTNVTITNNADDITIAASSLPTLFGTRSSARSIVAGTGITSGASHMSTSAERQMIFVAGSGGPVDISASPQIQAGTTTGQEMMIVGTSNINTVQLDNGTGLELNGSIVLGESNIITLVYDAVGAVWIEVSRS